MTAINQIVLDEDFMQPVLGMLNGYVRGVREGGALDDRAFVRFGLRRVLDAAESGRAFIQARGDAGDTLARSSWFDALHSARRLSLLDQLARGCYEMMHRFLRKRDWLGAYCELRQRAVWAVDGHQIEHASHARGDGKQAHVPVGTLYTLCLHTGLMSSLGCYQGDGQHGHEWPLFKKQFSKWLQMDKHKLLPIVVGDPAYLDIQYWALQKIRCQAVIVTREKENMKPMKIGPIAFDRSDPVNRGVLADEYVGYSSAHMRRIHYMDPATDKEFVFITTDYALRPGLIALLYFLRWKIEKSFDVFKNKLRVRKAWATGRTAATMQAHFVALLFNLLTVLLSTQEKAGIRERKVHRRQKQRQRQRPPDKQVPSQLKVRHALCMTCQFIRTLRHCLRYKLPWAEALPLFERRLRTYL